MCEVQKAGGNAEVSGGKEVKLLIGISVLLCIAAALWVAWPAITAADERRRAVRVANILQSLKVELAQRKAQSDLQKKTGAELLSAMLETQAEDHQETPREGAK